MGLLRTFTRKKFGEAFKLRNLFVRFFIKKSKHWTRFYDRLNKRMPYKFNFFKKKRLNVQKIEKIFTLKQSAANYLTLLRKTHIFAKRRFFKTMKKIEMKTKKFSLKRKKNIAIKFIFKLNIKNFSNRFEKIRRYLFKKFPLIDIFEFTQKYFQNKIHGKKKGELFDYTYPLFFSIFYSFYFFPFNKVIKTKSFFFHHFIKRKKKNKSIIFTTLILLFTPIFLFLSFNFIENIQLIEFANLTQQIFTYQQSINADNSSLISQLAMLSHPSFGFSPFFKSLFSLFTNDNNLVADKRVKKKVKKNRKKSLKYTRNINLSNILKEMNKKVNKLKIQKKKKVKITTLFVASKTPDIEKYAKNKKNIFKHFFINANNIKKVFSKKTKKNINSSVQNSLFNNKRLFCTFNKNNQKDYLRKEEYEASDIIYDTDFKSETKKLQQKANYKNKIKNDSNKL